MVADRTFGNSSATMTNRKMFATMLWGAVFRRRSRAIMAVIAVLVGAATLFCLAAVCIAVPQQMNEEMRAYGANLIVTHANPRKNPLASVPSTSRTSPRWFPASMMRNPPHTGMKACASTPRPTHWRALTPQA